ncbi:probable serine/threonine-protein kinase dyrk1 isoform X1 [Drosophila eugracilis]|uniref:probable serine/threonine-protein kinase dyrk1 isoform X1 n=1 Tax=Drosophila eugracilis TaxID=29029 RepID=UPI0007E77EB7|nr:probable serine/threonine-protein kinase dyrk1 isoform X1 [Drosophila eugracilis]XP_041673795.1 probable serine/threonine-protein kinase dyrk1 isoform X1 [Drosophila eugracilis]
MGQEISQQQNQQHQQHHQQHQHHQQQHQQQPIPHHKRQPQRKSFSGISNNTNQPIYTPASHLSSSSSSTTTTNNDYNNNNTNNLNNQNYRLRHKYNLSKQTYERSKITASQSDTDSHYAKLNLQRSSSQSSDSGIYNSSCHCSSISSISAVSSSASSSRSSSSSSRGCPSSLVSSKSNRSLDKQKHYLSHHLYIKSYLDILEEDERARAHFKSARPGGIRNYTPKILASGESSISGSSNTNTSSSNTAALSSSAPAHCYGPGKRTTTSTGGGSGSGTGKHCQEDPWI